MIPRPCHILPFCVAALLAGCAGNTARFLIEPASPATTQRVRVSTIEVRNVSLPAYASGLEIAVQQPDGALRNVDGSIWADDPERGITTALARNLDVATTATAAAEPWPLDGRAQVRVDVRVDRMLAGADGTFRFAGQFALSSPDGIIRERLQRFDISIPLPESTPAAVSVASGQAISALGADIARSLAR